MARKYTRDNAGRFSSGGTGATARGGRLKTASGKKRATQTSRIATAPKAGTVAKPKGLKPGAVSAKVKARAAAAKPAANVQRARLDGDAFKARMRRASGTSLRRGINESDRENALSGSQRRASAPAKRFAASNQRQARSDRTAAAARDFYNSFGSPSTFGRRQRQSTATSPTFGSKRRGKKRS